MSGQSAVYTTGVDVGNLGNGAVSAWTQPNIGGFGAGLWLKVDTARVLSPVDYTLGIGHEWYAAKAGDIIDATFASTAPVFANPFTGDLSGRIQLTGFSSFMLAFWLDSNDGQPLGNYGVPGIGDRFGWVRMTYDNAGFHLVDSAIESTGAGIIAGTTTAVPEPSTAMQGLLAACGVLAARRSGRGAAKGGEQNFQDRILGPESNILPGGESQSR